MPTLSIVIPIYNHPKELIIMIDSILENTFQDWELLAIDDGSERETLSILSQYAEKDARIHVIKRQVLPKGAPTCRNIGLKESQGKYIVFFDSDDYIPSYCLQQRVEIMEKNPDYDFMVFPSGSYSESDHFSKSGSYLYGYPIYKNDLIALIRRTLPFTVWTNIYLTKALKQQGILWDTNLHSFQDSDFNIQALLHHMRYAYAIAKPDYGYRTADNAGSISKKIISKEHQESHIYFLDKQYSEIHRVYGEKYNKALYQCALYIYSFVMSKGINKAFASKIVDIVYRHDIYHGRLIQIKLWTSQLLSTFLPSKLARQIPMPIFLIQKWWREHKITNKIEGTDSWNIS